MAKPAKKEAVHGFIHGIEFSYFPTTGKLFRSGKPIEAKNSHGQPHCLVGKYWVTVARIAFELMGVYVDREQRIEMIDGDQTNTRWYNMRVTDGLPKYGEETTAGTGWNNPVQYPNLRDAPGGLS